MIKTDMLYPGSYAGGGDRRRARRRALTWWHQRRAFLIRDAALDMQLARGVPGTPPRPRVAQLRALVGRFLGTLLYLAVIIVPALAVIACAAIMGAGQ